MTVEVAVDLRATKIPAFVDLGLPGNQRRS
jgi:hypothetical protein